MPGRSLPSDQTQIPPETINKGSYLVVPRLPPSTPNLRVVESSFRLRSRCDASKTNRKRARCDEAEAGVVKFLRIRHEVKLVHSGMMDLKPAYGSGRKLQIHLHNQLGSLSARHDPMRNIQQTLGSAINSLFDERYEQSLDYFRGSGLGRKIPKTPLT